MRVLFFCNFFRKGRYARQKEIAILLPEVALETIFLDQGVRVTGPPRWTLRQSAREYVIDEFDLLVHWPVSFQEQRARMSSRLYFGREYVARSWLVFEQALFSSIPASKQLNPYANAVAASNKALSLEMAAKNGIRIPRFLITNDAAAIREFAGSAPSVIKVLTDTNRIDSRSHFFPIRAEPDLPADSLEVLPELVQEEIIAERELRSYFFCGEVQIFGARRDTQHSAVDIRLQHPDMVRWERTSHSTVEALTRRLSAIFGLQFFSADFLEPRDEGVVFLDINPHASWHWMNRAAARSLDAAFALALRNAMQRSAGSIS